MMNVLETNNLVKKYKKFKALDKVNLHIEKGSIYGLIGKNGAGKTTLIKVLTGLQNPSDGTYQIYGVDYRQKEIYEVRERVSAMVESPSIILNMSAKENIIHQCMLMGIPSLDNIDELLDLVGLKDTFNKKVMDFSFGMKQRLGIAIALVNNPDVLILDEPINGLDPEGIIEIRELMLNLNKKRGMTILISSHYLDELARIATYYGFIDKGRVIKEISAKELNDSLRKKVEINVSSIKDTVKYLEKKNYEYEVLDKNKIAIYGKINITDVILELAKENCMVKEIKEKNESLENYFLQLVGDNDD